MRCCRAGCRLRRHGGRRGSAVSWALWHSIMDRSTVCPRRRRPLPREVGVPPPAQLRLLVALPLEHSADGRRHHAGGGRVGGARRRRRPLLLEGGEYWIVCEGCLRAFAQLPWRCRGAAVALPWREILNGRWRRRE
eukprot:gene6781-biopygen3240